MTIFFFKINERRRSSFKTSPLPLIFLGARAWPPGFVQEDRGTHAFIRKVMALSFLKEEDIRSEIFDSKECYQQRAGNWVL